MSTSIKVVGHLSLVGLMMALLGCGGASQEQEVTLESTNARLSYGIGLRMGQRCPLMVCRSMRPLTLPVLRTR